MAYATVGELENYLNDPAVGPNASSGMSGAGGVITATTRWDSGLMGDALDAAGDLIDGIFEDYCTISASSAYAKMLSLLYAGYVLLTSDLPEALEGEGKSRAGQMEKEFWRKVAEAKKSPGIFRGTITGLEHNI